MQCESRKVLWQWPSNQWGTQIWAKITSFTIIKQAPNNIQTRRERRPEEHPDRNDVNERSACNDHPTHSLCFRERDPNRNRLQKSYIQKERSVWKQMCTSTGRHRQPERSRDCHESKEDFLWRKWSKTSLFIVTHWACAESKRHDSARRSQLCITFRVLFSRLGDTSILESMAEHGTKVTKEKV